MLIDLKKLRHAVIVAREGNYGAAAVQAGISQSVLTRSVQALEAEYSVQIFERGRHGARLTPEGIKFIALAEDALARAKMAHEQLNIAQIKRNSTVSFGMGPIIGFCFLPELLRQVTREGLMVRVHIESNNLLQSFLRQGEIDFYVGGMARHLVEGKMSEEFEFQKISTSPITCLVREGHPLLSQPLIPETISCYPTAAGSFLRQTPAAMMLEYFGMQSPTLEMDDYGILLRVVRDTDFILIAASRMESRVPPGIVRLPLDLDVQAQVAMGIISVRRRSLSAATKHVMSILRQLATE